MLLVLVGISKFVFSEMAGLRIGGFVDAKFLRLFLQSVGNTAGSGVDAEAAFTEIGRIVEGMGEYPWQELRG